MLGLRPMLPKPVDPAVIIAGVGVSSKGMQLNPPPSWMNTGV
jgi:hypothetical protein